jgi:hypothetical protein
MNSTLAVPASSWTAMSRPVLSSPAQNAAGTHKYSEADTMSQVIIADLADRLPGPQQAKATRRSSP